MQKKSAYAGIDIGGTKILTGVLDGSGNLLCRKQAMTAPERDWREISNDIVQLINEIKNDLSLKEYEIKGLGVGCPGTISKERTSVLFAPNLNWRDVPIQVSLKEKTGLPVYLENDCNLQTLGVAAFGEGKDAESVIGVFIGTGIGGGIVYKGDLYTGFNGTAAEIGHSIIKLEGRKCGCGNLGCLEAYASTTNLYYEVKRVKCRKYGQLALEDPFFQTENRTLALKDCYMNGDSEVIRIVNSGAKILGIGIANLINIINPELIVLGGGFIEALGNRIIPVIKESAYNHSMAGTTENIKILKTDLKEDAGVFGGAALVKLRLET